jgi:methionyl-tRNA formyltransferase
VRIAFAGTPEFAGRILAALIAADHDVVLVLAQPDRPAGRDLKITTSPVKKLARQHGIAVHQPVSLKSSEAQAPLRDAVVEALVVAAYGLILPPAVLTLPARGCINVHASLLPRWRGAAPVQRAILAGDAQTGVSIMQMDTGLDTGPVLLARAQSINPDDTAGSLHDKLAALGAELIVEALAKLERGELTPQAQPLTGATYANKLSKEETVIDWRESAVQLERKVRAFDPAPGAQTKWRGEPLKVWRAALSAQASTAAPAGSVIAVSPSGVTVACGEGALIISELQKPSGKRLPVERFLPGNRIAPGEVLG